MIRYGNAVALAYAGAHAYTWTSTFFLVWGGKDCGHLASDSYGTGESGLCQMLKGNV